MSGIEFIEPDEDRTRSTADEVAVPEEHDGQSLAAVEAALSDLLAAVIPGDSPGSEPPKPAPRGPEKKARRRKLRGRLRAPRGVPIREAVLLAFSRILRSARGTVRHVAADPREALHDFRKSVRRARALVGLLRPALGRKAADGLASELRRAFEATGTLRDADILIAALRSVDSDDPARTAVERALEEEQSGDGSRAAEALSAGSRVLRPLPDVLRVTLPRAFSLDDLARGLARSARRARSTLAKAASTRSTGDFHEWRKRVKETRYQIELLASSGSAELKRREKTLAALAEELGKVTDLIVLQAALAEREKAGVIPAAPALAESIRATIAARSGELVARGQQVFVDAPADFARQVLAERG